MQKLNLPIHNLPKFWEWKYFEPWSIDVKSEVKVEKYPLVAELRLKI